MKGIFLTALVALGILIPVTFVPAQRSDTAAGAMDQNPQILITLIGSGGSVTANPDSVGVKRGQRVAWTSDEGDWQVTFTSDEPFGPGPDNRVISGKKGQVKGRPIQAAAPFKSYHYDIQVTLPDGTILTEDPEIVVERDGDI